jgi:hypothetical protein
MTLNMADSTVVSNLPVGTEDAYGGYVDGPYANFAQLEAAFPAHQLLSISTHGAPADCADVETGALDAAGAAGVLNAGGWAVYVQLSSAQALVDALAALGHLRFFYRLWIAHHNGVPHICTPACGYGLQTAADGTQWVDRGTYDQSLLAGDFFEPIVTKPKEGIVPAIIENDGAIIAAFVGTNNHAYVFTMPGGSQSAAGVGIIDLTLAAQPGNPNPQYTVQA